MGYTPHRVPFFFRNSKNIDVPLRFGLRIGSLVFSFPPLSLNCANYLIRHMHQLNRRKALESFQTSSLNFSN